MINVTKTYLPPFEEYSLILKRAWDKAWITNNGELVQELEQKLKEYLGVRHLLFTTNGTVVLQMALKAYNITGEVITTPFSYVATTNVLLWEKCTPVFADIDTHTFCIDPDKIEALITERTQAILATHVYGYPCAVEKIETIAAKHKLKVIYDGAHAFGAKYKEKALLSYGDISTCSFHATKLFHTVEGGCIICHDEETYTKLFLYRSFGHTGDDYYSVGINGKNSEFHAAMGLAVLPSMEWLIKQRKDAATLYSDGLKGTDLIYPSSVNISEHKWNYAYWPVLFGSEDKLLQARSILLDNGFNTRRYFFPSLNTLPFLTGSQCCPVSEDISRRVLCLPMQHDLAPDNIKQVCAILNRI